MQQKPFNEWIDDKVDSRKLPCGELLVSDKGQLVADYKNQKHTEKEETAIYRMFSMSKPIVTACAMITRDEGRLSIDDPVHLHLGPKWKKENLRVLNKTKTKQASRPVTVPCKVDITLRHLMTHTSGLSHGVTSNPTNILDQIYAKHDLSAKDTIELNPLQHGYKSLDAFLDKLVQMPLLFQPGTSWEYSYGFELVTRVVELANPEYGNLDEFARHKLFGPLGMTNTTFFLNEEQKKREVTIFLELMYHLVHLFSHFPDYVVGSAGLFSTTSDYFKFATMLCNRGMGPDGQRVLSEESARLMCSNQLTSPVNGQPSTMYDLVHPISLMPRSEFYGFGLGGSVCTKPGGIAEVGEYSWGGAGKTLFWVDFEKQIVLVFMTSVLEFSGLDPSEDLHRIVYPNKTTSQPHPGSVAGRVKAISPMLGESELPQKSGTVYCEPKAMCVVS